MSAEFLIKRFLTEPKTDVFIWKQRAYPFAFLSEEINRARDWLNAQGVVSGSVVALRADFTPYSVAYLFALLEKKCVVVPLSDSAATEEEYYFGAAGVTFSIRLDQNGRAAFERKSAAIVHELVAELRRRGSAGIIFFSSASTDKPKAALHDADLFLKKYLTPRKRLRTIPFLQFDHIGGLDTLFYCLSSLSCLVLLDGRSPETVCKAIEMHQVEVLPVSPTFLRLLILSEAYLKHDLSSLKYITYGTEVMPECVLDRCAEIFPSIVLLQKYGTTEIGTMRSKSLDSRSLWVRIGGEGYQTRVVDGILQVKSETAMLGYLNAPSPFTPDGWFNTGDRVEARGEYFKILGRASQIINVGGNKVHPAEVENVILRHPNVKDVTVYAEKNALLGQIVCAKVSVRQKNDEGVFEAKLRRFCRECLAEYKVPIKITLTEDKLFTARFKKAKA